MPIELVFVAGIMIGMTWLRSTPILCAGFVFALAAPALGASCEWAAGKFSDSAQLRLVGETFAKLPKENSAEWKAFVERIQADLDPVSGPGWTTLDLRDHLPEPVFRDLYLQCPEGSICVGKHGMFANGLVLPEVGPSTQLTPEAIAVLDRLTDWIERLLRSALPIESQAPEVADYRLISKLRGVKSPEWHTDGGSLVATLSLVGQGTDLLPKGSGRKVVPTSQGELVIFSGGDRRRRYPSVIPTVHRSPPGKSERLLFLFRSP